MAPLVGWVEDVWAFFGSVGLCWCSEEMRVGMGRVSLRLDFHLIPLWWLFFLDLCFFFRFRLRRFGDSVILCGIDLTDLCTSSFFVFGFIGGYLSLHSQHGCSQRPPY